MSFVSPILETDGVDARGLDCVKNDDGSLHCRIFRREDSMSFSGTNFEEIRTYSGVEKKTRHFGQQEDPHISMHFRHNTRCKAIGDVLECDKQ